MEFLTTNERAEFDLGILKENGFIRARHYSWREERNGLVVFASAQVIQVLYLPFRGGATRYFTIKAGEVEHKEWTLTYTNDFEEIYKVADDTETEFDLPNAVRQIFRSTVESGDSDDLLP